MIRQECSQNGRFSDVARLKAASTLRWALRKDQIGIRFRDDILCRDAKQFLKLARLEPYLLHVTHV